MKNNLLIILVKNPELGKVKTRLAVSIGEEEALNVYKQLLEHTRNVTQDLPFDKVIFYSDYVDHHDEWDNAVFQKQHQGGGGFGIRVVRAFEWGFEKGYSHICVIGSDCYELEAKIIADAFVKLSEHDIVIGPSLDGGYYLIGMKEPHPFLFRNKHWSAGSVLKETVKDIEAYNLSACLLAVLRDVDVESDLKTMAVKTSKSSNVASISIKKW